MSSINSERLHKELEKLETIGGVIGAAIVNRNGLLITSILPSDIDERKFGANTATMFGAMEMATSCLENENIMNLTVEFDDCQVIALGAGEQFILVALFELNINIGLIFMELEEIVKNLKKFTLY